MTPQPTPSAEDIRLAQELMAQLQNPQWSLTDAQLEDELDCDISAGPDLGSSLGRMLADPAGLPHPLTPPPKPAAIAAVLADL